MTTAPQTPNVDGEYVPTTEEVQAAWRVALYPQGVTADEADPPFALWLAAERTAAQREVVEWMDMRAFVEEQGYPITAKMLDGTYESHSTPPYPQNPPKNPYREARP